MKFLIAGLGSIGRRHLRNLQAIGGHEVLLFRTHQATLPDEDLEGFTVYTRLEEALAQKPDGVIISNPTSLHMDVALPAAEAGAHLLIEKPIAPTLEAIPALQAALQAQQKQALVGFHFRFHPVLKKVKDLIETGMLGRPLNARVRWGEYLPGWHPWEDYRQSYAARKDLGGGVVNTLSHPFDYLRWLLGEVESLSATTARISTLEIDTEDHAEISLMFQSGSAGSIHLDYYQRPPAHTLQISFEDGLARWDNAIGDAQIFSVAQDKWSVVKPPEGFERNQLFLAEMRHFVSVCEGREASLCGLEDGVRAQEIALAVHRSAAQGGCAVSLNPAPDGTILNTPNEVL